jgi:suppressor for copper-sensitivity B
VACDNVDPKIVGQVEFDRGIVTDGIAMLKSVDRARSGVTLRKWGSSATGALLQETVGRSAAAARSLALIVPMLVAPFFVACALFATSPGRVLAQDDFSAPELFPDFSLGGFGDSESEPDEWSASYLVTGPGMGRLDVEVMLAPSWHVYSITQEPGGPTKTTLALAGPSEVRITGAFQPSEPPLRSVSSVFKGVTVEEHEGMVIWSAPVAMPPGFDQPIKVSVDALVCKTDGSCIPVRQELTATQATASPVASAASAGDAEKNAPAVDPVGKPFRDDEYVVQWSGILTPSELQPGQRGALKFTAKPDVTYHVYRAAIDDSDSSTNFAVTDKGGLKIGRPETPAPVITQTLLPSLPPFHYHKGPVTWTLPIEVPAGAAAGEHTIEGLIAYQACTDNSCLRPVALKFSVAVTVAASSPATGTSSASVTMVSAKSSDALDAAASENWVDKIEPAPVAPQSSGDPSDTTSGDPSATTSAGASDAATADRATGGVAASPQSATQSVASQESLPSDSQGKSFAGLLVFAFIGGVILNFMPCVLPVVGLKVMSFVKQAGEDRGRILKLNIVYMLGILSVFAILAGLAVLLNFSWGQQFTFIEVKLGLTVLLFALALSYLGVWEIPAPSFAAGKKSQELEGREGYVGAFSKGAFATILATPCSGPLLGYIFGTTFGLSPAQTIVVIMTVGFGMSVPYLIIGARPELVSWLPKPGAWMETLKEFLAFLFLGTVAFFFAGFSDEHKLPVFITLIGVWFGCWIIGKVPNWASFQKRVTAWTAGIVSAAVIGIAAFQLTGGEATLQWVDYDEQQLAKLQDEGRTVMIDFTADWCVNCIVNYEVAIDTEETRKLLAELNAVPMIADWSDKSNTAIPAKLQELKSRSIPVLAIYPGSRPNQPIILRDLVSQSSVLEALRRAGPSVSAPSTSSSAESSDSGSLVLTNR